MSLNLSENSRKVLEKRYLKKDHNGKIIETAEEMFSRVAKAIASADKKYEYTPKQIYKTEEDFYQIMTDLEFMPNSPTLMNAGKELGQLSACFVLPIGDSMESIFETLKATALIHKSGGGTGFSFSRLRPKNSVVRSTGGVASGPVSFMKVFDSATQAVKQGGTRRGANMGILRVDHPDILEFITCKEGDKEINNFNISVAVTDEFMKKLENQEDYNLLDPHTNEAVNHLNTKMVFDLIIKMAHKNGEPGIIFIDRMNEFNPTPKLGKYESTNPCGEQVLLPYESCNLGSINLLKMLVKNNGSYSMDWEKLRNTVYKAVHFLDNVIDVNRFPLPEIEKQTKMTRKIGLGVMGWGSALLRMGIPYDSEEAVNLAYKVMAFVTREAKQQSHQLAKDKGLFPVFAQSKFAKNSKFELRNATVTTIAPTGTISLIAGPCSSGIEPIFAISYYRAHCLDNEKMVETDPVFLEVAKERGFYSEELMKKIAEKGSVQDLKEIPEDIRRVFVSSHDIAPEWHIKMQAAFQRHTDNAVSKTVNFPNQATEEDVRNVYLSAFNSGCKGVTIYRDGSREEQVLNIARQEAKPKPVKIGPRPRPEVVVGTTTKVSTGCGNLYVTINSDEHNKPFEVFTQMGKAGGCAASQLEAVGRLLSLAFRSGIDIKSIIDQLHGIRCPSPSWEKGVRIFSCADAISRVIERRLIDTVSSPSEAEDKIEVTEEIKVIVGDSVVETQEDPIASSGKRTSANIVGVCPDCGGALRHEEGCFKCHSCGFSKC